MQQALNDSVIFQVAWIFLSVAKIVTSACFLFLFEHTCNKPLMLWVFLVMAHDVASVSCRFVVIYSITRNSEGVVLQASHDLYEEDDNNLGNEILSAGQRRRNDFGNEQNLAENTNFLGFSQSAERMNKCSSYTSEVCRM